MKQIFKILNQEAENYEKLESFLSVIWVQYTQTI